MKRFLLLLLLLVVPLTFVVGCGDEQPSKSDKLPTRRPKPPNVQQPPR
jgi:hypothetical protein